MIKGKSLFIGSVVAGLIALGVVPSISADSTATAASPGLIAKVERDLVKTERGWGLPIDSARCRLTERPEFDAGIGALKTFKCGVRYRFGSDHWLFAYWLKSRQHISAMMSISTPWYNGDWYVDCRQTETKGYCLDLGERQMRSCMDRPSDRGYCLSVVYGSVDVRTGKPPRGANPVIVSTEADSHELGGIVHTGGCYPREGEMPPCAPDHPQTVGLPEFRTTADGRVSVRGHLEMTSEQIGPNPAGSARVSVRIIVDGNTVKARELELGPGEKVSVPIEARASMPSGEHEIRMEIEGSGFNYVNVAADSARLKAFASHRRK